MGDYQTDLFRRVGTLSDMQKAAIMQMGVECFLRCFTFTTCGYQTLRGAMCYVEHESPVLIDNLLHALNGDKEAQKIMSEFMVSPLAAEMAGKLHHTADLDMTRPEPTHEKPPADQVSVDGVG